MQSKKANLPRTWALSVFQNPIPEMVHGLKYADYPCGFEFIGRRIKKIPIPEELKSMDLMIPIPIHSIRKRERGFNQSERLAKEIEKSWNIKICSDVLRRILPTITQTRLSDLERASNIRNAIKCINKKKISGKSILLVDDVVTTGATLQACSEALFDAGVKSVHAFVVAWVPKMNVETDTTRAQ